MWFQEKNIPLYAVRYNPTQNGWTDSNKTYAHHYIDDASIGMKLLTTDNPMDRPYVDWLFVESELERLGLL